jgi:hypothetical protein
MKGGNDLTDIKILASQISSVLLDTKLVEGKDRLHIFYRFFKYIEGKPVIERIDNNVYRLITYNENYEYYKLHNPDVPFWCVLKEFNDDSERFVELLRQLFHGKARSSFNDKYVVISILTTSLTPEEIALKCGVKTSTISKFIFENDKYKEYLEFSIRIRKRALMENVVRYLKSNKIFKEETENGLLKQVVTSHSGFNKNKWTIIKFVLDGIQSEFYCLKAKDQIKIINEIKDGGMTVLTNHFRKRCESLLDNENE